MPNNSVRDKDAIAALCQVTEMISYYKKQGLSLCEQLFKIFEKYGAWQEDLINLELYGEKGAQQIESIMKTMRAKPISTWNGVSLKKVYDFNDISAQSAFNVPKSNVLQFLLEDGSKISMRPSGTEPKLKIYVSVCTHKPEVHQAYQETLNKIQNLRKEIANFIHEVTQ
jgi:phosphoglucomutase